jgi:hypothetical protein
MSAFVTLSGLKMPDSSGAPKKAEGRLRANAPVSESSCFWPFASIWEADRDYRY